mmetsp:Transcript_60392/g.197630  ORF Transcript_60392/g.197630 Transcript_60392/m.197630 type:complete len:230 (+) Transcript_60392:164-853(+)
MLVLDVLCETSELVEGAITIPALVRLRRHVARIAQVRHIIHIADRSVQIVGHVRSHKLVERRLCIVLSSACRAATTFEVDRNPRGAAKPLLSARRTLSAAVVVHLHVLLQIILISARTVRGSLKTPLASWADGHVAVLSVVVVITAFLALRLVAIRTSVRMRLQVVLVATGVVLHRLDALAAPGAKFGIARRRTVTVTFTSRAIDHRETRKRTAVRETITNGDRLAWSS